MLADRMRMSAVKDAIVAFLQANESTANNTVYTFSTENLGAAAASRKIVVSIGASTTSAGLSGSSVTVGGISATLVKAQQSSGGNNASELWEAAVPSGTSGDVVVTWGTGCTECGIGLWRVLNASDTYTDNAGTPLDNTNVSIDGPAGGIAIGSRWTGGGASTTIWTGLTEDFDRGNLGGADQHSGASDAFETEQTGLNVKSDSTAGVAFAMVVGAWGRR